MQGSCCPSAADESDARRGERAEYPSQMSSVGRRRWGRRSLVSTVIGITMCVLLAVPVWAYTSVKTRTVSMPGGSKTVYRSATAKCPKGQHVLFGGYKNGWSGMRRTADDLWRVDGFNLGGPVLKLTSYAYCGKGSVASQHTHAVEVTSSGTATVKCPSGKVVVAGGFATSPNTVFAVQRLMRVGTNRWQVSGYLRYGITKRTKLTAIAYCGKGPAPKPVSKTVKLTSAGGRATATCPSGKKLVFGGMVMSAAKPRTALVLFMRVEGTNTWAVGNSTAGGLTAIAYCR